MKKVIGISIVKNEADIIEAFIRYNLKYLDLMVVMDNMSSDNTRKILNLLADEGLALLIINDPVIAYSQSQKMSALFWSVMDAFQPDYIIPIDADEFLVVPDGKEFRACLEHIPDGEVGRLVGYEYVYCSSDDENPNLLTKMVYRKAELVLPIHTKIIIPASLCKDRGVGIAQGNHGAYSQTGETINSRFLPIGLAHLPNRSAGQVGSKLILGWLAYLCKPDRVPGDAYHWEEGYERLTAVLEKGEDIDSEVIQMREDEFDRLIRDPLPGANEIEIRYGNWQHTCLLYKAIKMAEDMSVRLAEYERIMNKISAVIPKNISVPTCYETYYTQIIDSSYAGIEKKDDVTDRGIV